MKPVILFFALAISASAYSQAIVKLPELQEMMNEGQKVKVINFWATWCAPCIKELPTLQQLERAQADEGKLGVIAVSQDMAPQGSVEAFLGERDIGRFAAYHDADMKLSSALGIQIMPTTILYDAEGKEVWRYVGDLDWTGEEAKKLLSELPTPPSKA